MELLHGDWREVFRGIDGCDHVITDPPYSEATHDGHAKADYRDEDSRRDLIYGHLTPGDVSEAAAFWAPRVRGWMAIMSDHELVPDWRRGLKAGGLTASFAPVPCVIPGMTCRMAGDGPSSWAVYLNVARTKAAHKWGTLPGAYVVGRGERRHIGGKPVRLMRAIVRDYTRPGDLIVDPYAGAGTTLLAASMEGRQCIGCEIDPEVYGSAIEYLARHQQQTLNLFEAT
jgi:site-specific DNA-methyltransferase (adenine-specific)